MGILMNEHSGQHRRKTNCNFYDGAFGKNKLSILVSLGVKWSPGRTLPEESASRAEIKSALEEGDPVS
jgi:hypothetical protein